MKIIFCDLNTALCENVKILCLNLGLTSKQVEVHSKKFQELESFDAIVAAGNSFGIMSGGIDLHIKEFFDEKRFSRSPSHELDEFSVQSFVKKKIDDEYLSELPVGSSIVVDTYVDEHPFIIYAPTMRAPMFLDPTNNNVYNSTLSAVTTIAKHNATHEKKIETVVFSGMGTGTGFYPLDKTARQMVFAFMKLLSPEFNNRLPLAYEIARSYQLGIADLYES